MTAPILIKITSATFKGKTIAGATTANISIQGSEQMVRGGGAFAMQAAYVEGIHAKITVGALQSQISDNDLVLPGNGSLVIVGFTQADGSGAAGGGTKTWTFPNTTLVSSDRGIPLDGNPTVNLSLTAVAASGDPADIYSIA